MSGPIRIALSGPESDGGRLARTLGDRADVTVDSGAADVLWLRGGAADLGPDAGAGVRAGGVLVLGDPAEWSAADTAQLTKQWPGRTIVPALTHRFEPGVQRLAGAVLGGEIGLPWAVQAEQVARPEDEAGGLPALLAQTVDAVTSILGLRVKSVVARASGPLDAESGVVVATLIFEHDLGASITVSRIAGEVDASRSGDVDHRIRVMGNEGVLLSDLGRPAVVINGGLSGHRYGPTALDGLLAQVRAAAAGQPYRATSPVEFAALGGVLDAIRRSIAESTVIHLTDHDQQEGS